MEKEPLNDVHAEQELGVVLKKSRKSVASGNYDEGRLFLAEAIVIASSAGLSAKLDRFQAASELLHSKQVLPEVLATPYVPVTPHQLADRMKTEVLEDVNDGHVPRTVSAFSELHDYVDANCYGGTEALWDELPIKDDEVDEDARNDLFDLMNTAMGEVDPWLKTGEMLNDLKEKPSE